MSNETDLQESAVQEEGAQEEGAQEEANRETDLHEYTTYPRRFISYRWFKPVLVGLISLILYIAVIVAAFLAVYFGGIYNPLAGDTIAASYDNLDVSSVLGVVFNLGGVAVMIPCFALAAKIVGDRPFSSYSSSRGGWHWKLFFKCLLICLVVIGIPVVISNLIIAGDGITGFSAATFAALTIVGPLQCVAEEYFFRAFLLQTLGSWFRVPAIAIAAAALIFASMHPYNTIGVVSVLVSGLIWGTMAKVTKGLEASSAAHIVNNMTIFYMMGLGMTTLSSNQPVSDMIISVVKDLVYFAVILYIARKLHWFDEVRRDDVTPFNAKVEAKRAAKEAKRAAKEAEGAAKEAK